MSGAPRAVLIGPPGAGKSTVGAALARHWGIDLADTDALVEEHAGRAIAEIFVEDGEPAFRALETTVVLRALAEHHGVLALGGGAPMQSEVGEALAGLPVVFLDVTIADAAGRIGLDTSRPLLAVNPRARWTELMGRRRPTYERLARHRVDTAGRRPDEVAVEVAGLLGSGAR